MSAPVEELAGHVDNVALLVVGLMQRMALRLVDPDITPADSQKLELALEKLGEAFGALGSARQFLGLPVYDSRE